MTALKAIGHDLATFGQWVEKALPIAGSVLTLVQPQLGPVVTAVESLIKDLENATGKQISATDLQTITQAITVLQAVQATVAAGQTAQLTKSVGSGAIP